MKAFLTRKLFGKIPVWVVLILAGGLGFYVFKRNKAKTPSTDQNPAANANQDGSQPYPFSSPDMFPLQGGGIAAPQGPPVTGPAPGIVSNPVAVRRYPGKSIVPKPTKRVVHTTVGNRVVHQARPARARIPVAPRPKPKPVSRPKPITALQQYMNKPGVGRD